MDFYLKTLSDRDDLQIFALVTLNIFSFLTYDECFFKINVKIFGLKTRTANRNIFLHSTSLIHDNVIGHHLFVGLRA